jgi:hypothetical protein
MGSAGVRIPEEALMFFRGKRVRIFIDNDPKGLEASTRWAGQLMGVGCSVDGFDFTGLVKRNGEAVKDLNDCSQLSDESINQHGSLLAGMMDFLPKQPMIRPKAILFMAPITPDSMNFQACYWNNEEIRAIQGTGLEKDDLIEQLAMQFNAQILVDQIRKLTPEELYNSRGSIASNAILPCPA